MRDVSRRQSLCSNGKETMQKEKVNTVHADINYVDQRIVWKRMQGTASAAESQLYIGIFF